MGHFNCARLNVTEQTCSQNTEKMWVRPMRMGLLSERAIACVAYVPRTYKGLTKLL